MSKPPFRPLSQRHFATQQQGAALFFALIFLVITTMLALVATRGSTMQALAASNQQQSTAALNAADSGLGAAIESSNVSVAAATTAGHIINDSIMGPRGDVSQPYAIVADAISRCVTSTGNLAACTGQKLDAETSQVTSAKVTATYLGCSLIHGDSEPRNVFRLDSTGTVADTNTSVSAIVVVKAPCMG